MKNIHILPTDKPSRLWTNNLRRRLELDEFPSQYPTNIAKHIYITSDEEIKEGVNQWYLDKFLNKPYNSGGAQYSSKQDVIIMTTDQDLIKDGVQAIDDEFLQWFVKNPSCEEIEIEQEKSIGYAGDRQRTFYGKYKIIIPKEENSIEAKQRAKNYMSLKGALEPKQIKCYCGHTIMCDCSPIDEPKQETLEEAAHKMLMDFGIMSVGESINVLNVKKLMVLFAKERQERMYSEEEVRNLFRNYQYDSAQFAAIMEGDTDGKPTPTGWFEKFKKK